MNQLNAQYQQSILHCIVYIKDILTGEFEGYPPFILHHPKYEKNKNVRGAGGEKHPPIFERKVFFM